MKFQMTADKGAFVGGLEAPAPATDCSPSGVEAGLVNVLRHVPVGTPVFQFFQRDSPTLDVQSVVDAFSLASAKRIKVFSSLLSLREREPDRDDFHAFGHPGPRRLDVVQLSLGHDEESPAGIHRGHGRVREEHHQPKAPLLRLASPQSGESSRKTFQSHVE